MKIHNIIKVTNIGSIYSTFKDMAIKLDADFDKWKSGRNGHGIEGFRAKILNIGGDGRYHILIEMIEGDHFGEQYVIDKGGIKLDMASEILSDDMFEI